jgi:hypothetical protein
LLPPRSTEGAPTTLRRRWRNLPTSHRLPTRPRPRPRPRLRRRHLRPGTRAAPPGFRRGDQYLRFGAQCGRRDALEGGACWASTWPTKPSGAISDARRPHSTTCCAPPGDPGRRTLVRRPRWVDGLSKPRGPQEVLLTRRTTWRISRRGSGVLLDKWRVSSLIRPPPIFVQNPRLHEYSPL